MTIEHQEVNAKQLMEELTASIHARIEKERQERTLPWVALLIGVACFGVAIWINANYQVGPSDFTDAAQAAMIAEQDISVSNYLPVGTALGLSIGGGLCVLGACLADCKRPMHPDKIKDIESP